jgi:phosphatidylinositol-3-phosphatase
MFAVFTLAATTAACDGEHPAASVSPATSDSTPGVVPQFSHAVVVLFENKGFSRILEGSEAPTFKALAHRYALLTNYQGVAHPSLPNYLALVSGSTHGISSDCSDCIVDGLSLADTLDRRGLSWRAYAEGIPKPGSNVASDGRYVKRHVPFLYFEDVQNDATRMKRVVPLDEFSRDLADNRLPTFSLVIPGLCHDMHDCPVAEGDAWLRTFSEPLLKSPAFRAGVLFILFDESGEGGSNGGHVPAIVAGPTVRPGSTDAAPLTHYSALRTFEEAWNLELLGASAEAPPITTIWRRGS